MRKSTQTFFPTAVPVESAPGREAGLPFGQGEPRHAHRPLRSIGRPDPLTAQHVEVAIVLNAMLGRSAANDYLTRNEVAEQVIERVLSPGARRRGKHDANGILI